MITKTAPKRHRFFIKKQKELESKKERSGSTEDRAQNCNKSKKFLRVEVLKKLSLYLEYSNFRQKNRTPSQRRPYKNNSFYDSEISITLWRYFVNEIAKKGLDNF